MIGDCEVRLEGCICELGSDMVADRRDMRSTFGYTTLGAIADDGIGGYEP